MTARIALIDIETAPGLGYAWEAYDTNIIKFKQHWYMLSFAWKWLEEETITVKGLIDYPGYDPAHIDDRLLVTDLHAVLDEADIVVAHNGDAFDIRKSNTRFAVNGLPPPSTYKTIDTLKIIKKHFRFERNGLSDLGESFGVGKKGSAGGFKTWEGCMSGDRAAWDTLLLYNAQDVLLLEKIYLKVRAWSTTHPNLNIYSHKEDCPSCQSMNVQRRGFNYAKVQVRQRWNCQDCGHWYSGKVVKR